MHACSVALHAFANGTTTPPQQRGWYDRRSKTESVTGAIVPDGYAAAGLMVDALATHGRPDAVRVRVCHAATRVLLSEMVCVRLLLGDSDERVSRCERDSVRLDVALHVHGGVIVLLALCVGLVLSDHDDRDARRESLADEDGNERVTLVESDVDSVREPPASPSCFVRDSVDERVLDAVLVSDALNDSDGRVWAREPDADADADADTDDRDTSSVPDVVRVADSELRVIAAEPESLAVGVAEPPVLPAVSDAVALARVLVRDVLADSDDGVTFAEALCDTDAREPVAVPDAVADADARVLSAVPESVPLRVAVPRVRCSESVCVRESETDDRDH